MPVRLKPLSQQVVVITGASSGIGLATAEAAAAAGAAVVLAARNGEALKQIADRIEENGGRAAYVVADIADESAPQRIGQVAKDRFGGFDTWVNNAATALYARLLDTGMDEHRQVFDIGYFGLVAGSIYAARELKERGGAIINVGSILSERSVPVQGAYSSMKHAVKGFTDTLRSELEMEEAPISVTLIKPAAMDTPYSEHARNKMDAPATVPPPAYDPRLSAKAILFAAEHPKRSLTVGGAGFGANVGHFLPSLTDRLVEALMGESSQSIDQPPEPGVEDNLFEAREDGRIDSNQDRYVRRTSLALEAQMHPIATAAILGGVAALAAGALLAPRALKRRSPDAASPVQEPPLEAV